MAKKDFIWYKDPMFVWSLRIIGVLGIIFTVGTWIVDKEIRFETPLLILSMMGIIVGMGWLFRNNL